MANVAATLKAKSEDPTTAINSKSLVRQSNKIAARGSAKFASNALRKVSGGARLVGKALGTIFGMPAMIAGDLLDSKKAGTDRYGRAIDTPEGFELAQRDNKVADYFLTYGTYPEESGPDSFNEHAVGDRIANKLRSEHMAEQLRQINNSSSFMKGQAYTQPTPEQQNRQKFRYEVMRELEPSWTSEIKERKMVGPSQKVMDQVASTSRKS